jgi:hypothetical protein
MILHILWKEMTDMTTNSNEMYDEWENHTEGQCPKCGEGDTSMAQEFNQFWTRWDTRPEKMSTDGEEMVLIRTKCSVCDWEGSFMYELGPFAGYITDEQMKVHEAIMEAKDEARNQAVMDGVLCFMHEVENCDDPMCQAPVPEPQPINHGEAFSMVNRALASVVDEEE